MIESVQATGGFAKELFGARVFKFKPGLNVMLGPNGSGKSTIIGLAAAYTGCHEHGWSSAVPPEDSRHSFDMLTSREPYPDKLHLAAPGRCTAKVAWDGSPSYLFSATFVDVPKPWLDGSLEQITDILTSRSASSGQLRLMKLVRVAKDIPNMPNLVAKPNSRLNEPRLAMARDFAKYVKSIRRRGWKLNPTILFDEPDRSLGLAEQLDLWTRVVQSLLVRNFQVIIASHSPLPLVLDVEATLVEMVPGYADRCRELLRAGR